MLSQNIIDKYNKPAPRYTSYPPANFFTGSFTGDDYKQMIIDSNSQSLQHISVYIHIPFCYKLCFYCGCNSMLLRKQDNVDTYISYLKKEIRMGLSLLDKSRKISQIHYGGGTPTFLPVETIKELNELILSEFTCIESPEIAIECHPGYMDEKYWEELSRAGFTRVSIGVQDFDKNVLKAVNRKAAQLPVKDIITILREKHISVNMDFIFGLPLQTVGSFAKTIEKAIDLHPDRLVTFSYAHVPWVNRLQMKLEKIGLPAADQKEAMYNATDLLLHQAGYKSVGMDHFVLPSDELHEAKMSGRLHRNFQGYCTRRTTGQVYAFGITGISQLSAAYSQNVKDISSYISMISDNSFPVLRGYKLNENERIRREVITRLMCNYTIKWHDIAADLSLSVSQIKSTLIYNEELLAQFSEDGIIEFSEEHLSIQPAATPFVRNVAASFDPLLVGSDKQFSRSV